MLSYCDVFFVVISSQLSPTLLIMGYPIPLRGMNTLKKYCFHVIKKLGWVLTLGKIDGAHIKKSKISRFEPHPTPKLGGGGGGDKVSTRKPRQLMFYVIFCDYIFPSRPHPTNSQVFNVDTRTNVIYEWHAHLTWNDTTTCHFGHFMSKDDLMQLPFLVHSCNSGDKLAKTSLLDVSMYIY